MTVEFPPMPFEDEKYGYNNNAYNPHFGATVDVKKAFMDEIRPICQALERRYGIPAAFLGAQAAQESGCGTTRIAVYANNLNALKDVRFWGRKGEVFQDYDNVPNWQLYGQPDEAWDGSVRVQKHTANGQQIFEEPARYDNWYYKFDSKHDALDFMCRVCIIGTSFGRLYPEYLNLWELIKRYQHTDAKLNERIHALAFGFGARGYCHVESKRGSTAEERRGNYYAEVISAQARQWNTYAW